MTCVKVQGFDNSKQQRQILHATGNGSETWPERIDFKLCEIYLQKICPLRYLQTIQGIILFPCHSTPGILSVNALGCERNMSKVM